MLEGMELIRRDFLVPELQRAMQEGRIDGVVTVQARQSLVETEKKEHESRAMTGAIPILVATPKPLDP
jgi:hypothetical protein